MMKTKASKIICKFELSGNYDAKISIFCSKTDVVNMKSPHSQTQDHIQNHKLSRLSRANFHNHTHQHYAKTFPFWGIFLHSLVPLSANTPSWSRW
jgi:hypothetical protein